MVYIIQTRRDSSASTASTSAVSALGRRVRILALPRWVTVFPFFSSGRAWPFGLDVSPREAGEGRSENHSGGNGGWRYLHEGNERPCRFLRLGSHPLLPVYLMAGYPSQRDGWRRVCSKDSPSRRDFDEGLAGGKPTLEYGRSPKGTY